ncbi:X2-like carbohydrate binding domain-containing protein, partial [Paenibacillus taihuensis]|uniref:X2-like carbohydrate binding domain-containing protein n=1 Tax=Paenibacillus taihuensis TaxID=1156355 RepID=UPI001FEA9A76
MISKIKRMMALTTAILLLGICIPQYAGTVSAATSTWTTKTSSGIDGDFYAAAYDGTSLLAVSFSSFNSGHLYKLNGMGNWVQQTISFTPALADNTYTLSYIMYTGTKWVLTGMKLGTGGYDSFLATSSDGILWNIASNCSIVNTSYGQGNLFGASFHGNTYVAVGGINGSVDGQIMTSTDGGATCTSTQSDNSMFYGVTYANNLFVAVGNNGIIYTSSDGLNWTLRDSHISGPLDGIAYGNGHFVAVGANGDVAVSADGTTWTASKISGAVLYAITYANGLFVAGGESQFYSSSDDGSNWEAEAASPSLGSHYINMMMYNNGQFLAFGSGGVSATRISVSTDSTISPATGSFDKNPANQADISTTMTLNGNTLSGIANGAAPLVSGTDYSVSG